MNIGTQTAFYYHADASALGGVLTHPLDRIVSTPGTISLAQAGGSNSARVDSFKMDGLVSFESAHVSVSGSEHNLGDKNRPCNRYTKEDGGWRTIATASIERLNIHNVVTADRLVSQVSVMHPYEDGPLEISFNGTQFVNLRVNGEEVKPQLDRRIFGVDPGKLQKAESAGESLQSDRPRFNHLLQVAELQYQEGVTSRKRLVERLGQRFAVPDPKIALDQKGSALCSLVQGVEVAAPAEGYGRLIHVPDFGNIFLGEILVNRFSAQLTMLRVEMGCMARGSLSVCSAYSNGSTMP